MSGLYEVTEESMIRAHKAGVDYWQRNKPVNATREGIESLARSKHWHGDNMDSFVAGFFGAKRREEEEEEARNVAFNSKVWGIK